MRLQRVAAVVAAAVGVGFLLAGCGSDPGTGTGATAGKGDTGKSAPTGQTGGDKGKELADKVKAATDDVSKEVDSLKKGLGAFKAKVDADKKNAGSDANKLEAANKLDATKDEAEAQVKQIDEKVAGLKNAKDAAALDAAVKAIKEQIEKVKPVLKDYLPK